MHRATKVTLRGSHRRSQRVVILAALALQTLGAASAVAAPTAQLPVVADAVSGVVTSGHGPEAGVWVIAESTNLPTRHVKIVVTDDAGRYVLPELPEAQYKVWVRGYGLVDSEPVASSRGKRLDLRAKVAPSAAAAAQYYPASYWYSLIEPPGVRDFPGTGPNGNGIGESMRTQQHWLAMLKDGCVLCHQLGTSLTRTLADNTADGWKARISKAQPLGSEFIGDQGPGMAAYMAVTMNEFGFERGVQMFTDWTRRIASGEVPRETPPRPTGLERNVVISQWQWGKRHFLHDIITTDRRNPTLNANGPIYGAASKHGYILAFDPKTATTRAMPLPTGRIPHDYRGAYPHTLMMDSKGRVWDAELAGRFWPLPTTWPDQPPFCTEGSLNPFAAYFPMPGKDDRAIYMYDPARDRMHRIANCYGGHHLQFGYDRDETLYFSGDGAVVGWLKTAVWDQTQDPARANGWCPLVVDTNGKATDGYAITPDRTQWNEPGQPIDPSKDTRLAFERFLYGIDTNPVDGSIWAVSFMPMVPSRLVRLDLGSQPPRSCVAEVYEPPKLADGRYAAFGGRGVAIDSAGIAWVAFDDGHVGRFDRRRCKTLKGPAAMGQHCPEGWDILTTPGPTFQGVDASQGNTDYLYQPWVDRFDILGLGKDTPVVTGTMSDSLMALDRKTQRFWTLRVPYPLGFYTRWLDGRIDDPKGGWKGRAYWATYASMGIWHQENGEKGYGPQLVKFQLRPNPLAH
jgi:hypothetical protein